MGLAVGIDLGTTHTVVAAVRDGGVSALADAHGTRLIPSVVWLAEDGSVTVGEAAKAKRASAPRETIHSVKRLIGRPWETGEVERAVARLGFRLVEGDKHEIVAEVRGERYTLPEISACVLRQAKANAESATKQKVDRAVITVPASFNDIQRNATKFAGELAGFEVLRILNEPTAAALSYGCGATPETIAVYDLGGGTFDFTLLHLAGNVFEVLGTAGDTSLGGDDLDNLIAERIIDQLHTHYGIDAFEIPNAVSALQLISERLKRELSIRTEATVLLSDALPGKGLPEMRFALTRGELDQLSNSILAKTITVCQNALTAASLTPERIDRTILVGGATRQPLVLTRVRELFHKRPVTSINPEEVVALGAAIHAASLDKSHASRVRSEPRGKTPATGSLLPSSPSKHPGSSVSTRDVGAGASQPPGRTELARIKLKRHVVRGGEAIEQGRASTAPSGDRPLTAHHDRAAERTATGEGEHAPLSLDFEADLGSSRPLPPSSSSGSLPRDAGSSGAFDAEPGSSRDTDAAPPSSQRHGSVPLLIDVTPLSLGVETAGGYCDPLIEANTPIPCDRTRTFATAADGQTSVFVRVAQGASMHFRDNAFLGEVELEGLVPAPRGEIKIRVTFELDANGMLNVRAKDSKTGRETAVKIRLHATAEGDVARANMRARQDFMVLTPL